MKPAAFGYHRPRDLAEALSLMGELGEDARWLAGGQSLVPLLNLRLASPSHLVDISRLAPLAQVEFASDAVNVGAACTMAALERERRLSAHHPLLAAALPHVGHFQIRNRATVGGSLCHLDAAAELPAIALLTGARMEIQSRAGSRSLVMDDFWVGPMESALRAGELVTSVRFPWLQGCGWGFGEVARRQGDFALVGAAAQVTPQGQGRVVVFGAGARAQVFEAPAGLTAGEFESQLEARLNAGDDIHASAAYRRRVGSRLARRILEEARGRAV